MRIVENAYYDHSNHGKVKILKIEDNVVHFSTQDSENLSENMSEFEGRVEPADVTVDADPATLDLTGKDPK